MTDVRCDVRAYTQTYVLDVPVFGQKLYLVLDLAFEQYRRLDLARTVACGAYVGDILHGDGANPLARDLHEPELRQRQNRVLGLVGSHELGHLLKEQLAVLCLVQVDEVDDDDATQIAQAQLAGDLLGGGHVYLHCGLLLIDLSLCAVARVDVDDVHGLRMFDDEVGAALERYILGEQRLDLLRYVEVVEYGYRAAV